MIFLYAHLIVRLRYHDWPSAHACNYVVWDYTTTRLENIHDHDHYELLWVESGVGCHFINEQYQRIETGDLVLIRPEDTHAFSVWQDGGAVRFINFAFLPEIWETLRDAFLSNELRFFDKSALSERQFHISADERERLRLMAADLASGRWTRFNASAFLHGILALLENHESGATNGPSLPDWLTHAVRTIERWPHFAGGVQEFVRLAGRSHEHVCRDCQRLIGNTPRELVNRARLRWAAMQLETTEKKIIDIALECGFENLGHFYKCFRAAHHRTPRTYRLQFGIRERE